MLKFVDDMRKYRGVERTARDAILNKAMKGSQGKEWCYKFGHDFDYVINKLINQMMQREDWKDLMVKMVRGESFAESLEEHLKYFKLVAKYMGMRAEDQLTKKGPSLLGGCRSHPAFQRARRRRKIYRLSSNCE